MIVSHKYKFIFIHIDKCAGTSITLAMAPHLGEEDLVLGCTKEGEKRSVEGRKAKSLWKHATAQRAKTVLGDEIWNSYFKFTFVRNPWDMVVSTYHWWLKTSWNDAMGRSKKIRAMKDFKEYVLSPYVREKNCLDYISDENGDIIVDFMGRHEKLEVDFSYICGRVGLPNIELLHENKSKHKSYNDYYDQDSRRRVRELFNRDIEYFHYRFDN